MRKNIRTTRSGIEPLTTRLPYPTSKRFFKLQKRSNKKSTTSGIIPATFWFLNQNLNAKKHKDDEVWNRTSKLMIANQTGNLLKSSQQPCEYHMQLENDFLNKQQKRTAKKSTKSGIKPATFWFLNQSFNTKKDKDHEVWNRTSNHVIAISNFKIIC